MSNKSGPRNHLSNTNLYALTRLLDTNENKAKLLSEDDTFMAALASEKLKFKITAKNIENVRGILGIRKRHRNGANGQQTLKGLEERVTAIDARLAALEKALA